MRRATGCLAWTASSGLRSTIPLSVSTFRQPGRMNSPTSFLAARATTFLMARGGTTNFMAALTMTPSSVVPGPTFCPAMRATIRFQAATATIPCLAAPAPTHCLATPEMTASTGGMATTFWMAGWKTTRWSAATALTASLAGRATILFTTKSSAVFQAAATIRSTWVTATMSLSAPVRGRATMT